MAHEVLLTKLKRLAVPSVPSNIFLDGTREAYCHNDVPFVPFVPSQKING